MTDDDFVPCIHLQLDSGFYDPTAYAAQRLMFPESIDSPPRVALCARCTAYIRGVLRGMTQRELQPPHACAERKA